MVIFCYTRIFSPLFPRKWGFLEKHKKPLIHYESAVYFLRVVEVTGLEPATAWSQTRNATNCATPRFSLSGCKGTHFLRPLQIFQRLFYDSLLNEDFLQGNYRAVYLLLGVRSHQGVAHKGVLWGTSRRNDGVDEHTSLEGKCRHQEGLVDIAHIERNDRTLGIANLEALLTETLQGVVCDIPQCLNALRLTLNDVQGGHSGGSGCGRIRSREDIGATGVTEPVNGV